MREEEFYSGCWTVRRTFYAQPAIYDLTEDDVNTIKLYFENQDPFKNAIKRPRGHSGCIFGTV